MSAYRTSADPQERASEASKRPRQAPPRLGSVTTPPIAPYVHRRVPLDVGGRRLEFATCLDLFSSHQVDVGSRLLLRTIEPVLAARGSTGGARVLDLGCGYGALGVALATLPAVAAAHLVDRDALAVDFAAENARANAVEVTTALSLGLAEVLRDAPEARYDLVVSNLPGKAGATVLSSMLLGALGVLAPGGLVAVVVIEPIRDLVASTLSRDDIEVTLRRDTADYSVFHYGPAAGTSFPPPAEAFDAGVYDRGALPFEDANEQPATITTVEGIPNYDRIDVIEAALTRRIPRIRPGQRVLVSNVAQGYLAAYVRSAQPEAHVILVDRDVLALRTARRALLALGAVEDRVEMRVIGAWSEDSAADTNPDLVVGVLHEGGGAPAVEAEYSGLVAALAPGGRAVLAGGSTAITRLLAHALPPGCKASRTKHRGTSFLEVTRAL